MNPVTEQQTPEQPITQRADARRNREAIMEAARERFSELGLNCQMEDIARSAGVGIGTVYRHFPNKDALLQALIDDRFQKLARRANELLAEEGDPWDAFCGLMRWSAELSAADRGLSGMLSRMPEGCGQCAVDSGLADATAELIARAQASGQMREDVVVTDVPTFMTGLGSVLTAPEDSIPAQNWERFLALMLDGMRAPGNSETQRLPKAKGSMTGA